MLLESFDKANRVGFRKINKMLKENYGITLSKKISANRLHKMTNVVKESINELKLAGESTQTSKELSRNILILQGLTELRNSRTVYESYAMTGPYSKVIRWMADYIAKNMELGDEYEMAIEQAMREYRSSKWRFPDEQVRYDSSNLAVSELKNRDQMYSMTESKLTESIKSVKISDVLDESQVKSIQHWLATPGADMDKGVMTNLHEFYVAQGLKPGADNDIHDWYFDHVVNDFGKELCVGLSESAWDKVMDKTGRYTAHSAREQRPGIDFPSDWGLEPMDGEEEKEPEMDPEMLKRIIAFNKKRMSKEKAEEMKENYVRKLRALLESEVDEAEAIVGARGLSQEVQEMIQKVGRIQNEKLPPLTDQVRDTFGEQEASSFQQGAYQSFQGVIESLYTAKDQIDGSVGQLSGQGGGEFEMDMDAEMGGGDPSMDIEMGAEGDLDGLGGDMDAGGDLGGMEDDLGGMEDDLGDEFGGAEEEDPLGRAAFESKKVKAKAKIAEMERMLAKMKKLQESKKRTGKKVSSK